jgi:hypothetical protein
MEKIQLPKSWNDITVYQFQELSLMNIEDYDSDIDIVLDQLAIITDYDADDEIYDYMDIDDLLNIMKNISWIKNEPPQNYTKEFKPYRIKELVKLTLGEFIDLEVYFSDNYIKNLHLICAILYKQYKIDEWSNEIEEPYIYNLKSRADKYLDVRIPMVWGVIKAYLDFKEIILDKYHVVFNNEGDELEDTTGLSEEEIIEINKEIEEDKKKAKWSWPALINNLAEGDITKYDAITNQPLILVLNELAMRKALKLNE